MARRPTAPRAGARARQAWGAGVLVAAAALVGIIVVAADGQPLSAPEASDTIDIGSTASTIAVVALGLAFVGGLVIIVLSILTQQRRKPVWPRPRAWWFWPLAFVVALLAYLVIGSALGQQEDPPADGGPEPRPAAESEEADPDPPPWALLALGGVVVIALGGAVMATRRLQAQASSTGAGTDALVSAIDAALADLDGEGDPRAVIIAAYARLLDGFASAGVGRQNAETPFEHLRRGLAELEVRPAPAERLTALFVEARFSTHPLGELERDEAIAAFRAVRDDLARAAPVPAASP
jgi:hypothetical protein